MTKKKKKTNALLHLQGYSKPCILFYPGVIVLGPWKKSLLCTATLRQISYSHVYVLSATTATRKPVSSSPARPHD